MLSEPVAKGGLRGLMVDGPVVEEVRCGCAYVNATQQMEAFVQVDGQPKGRGKNSRRAIMEAFAPTKL
jgi:hypothetical protein